MKVAWVRHRGTPQGVAHLLDLDTWRSPCGIEWGSTSNRLHWSYYEPVPVAEPTTFGMTTGRPGDNACAWCIQHSWLSAVHGELEITTLLDSQPPLPMAVET